MADPVKCFSQFYSLIAVQNLVAVARAVRACIGGPKNFGDAGTPHPII